MGSVTAGKKRRLEWRSERNSKQPPATSRREAGHAPRFITSSSRAATPLSMTLRSMRALRLHTFQMVNTPSCRLFHLHREGGGGIVAL